MGARSGAAAIVAAPVAVTPKKVVNVTPKKVVKVTPKKVINVTPKKVVKRPQPSCLPSPRTFQQHLVAKKLATKSARGSRRPKYDKVVTPPQPGLAVPSSTSGPGKRRSATPRPRHWLRYDRLAGKLYNLLKEMAGSELFLVIAVDEAQVLSSKQLENLRRHWSPERRPDGTLTRTMPEKVFLTLVGTTSQLDTLAPLPSKSGSGRLAEGSLYLPPPFTALEVSDLDPLAEWDNTSNPIENWPQKGRRLWSSVSDEQARTIVNNFSPSLWSGRDLSEAEVVAALSQKITFDVLGPGAAPGHYEATQKLRAMQVDQINQKLLWLRAATCRGHQLDTTTLSEPLPAFWIGVILTRQVRAWARVLEGSDVCYHRLADSPCTLLSSGFPQICLLTNTIVPIHCLSYPTPVLRHSLQFGRPEPP